MNRMTRYLHVLAAVAVVGVGTVLMPAPPPAEPFDERSWAADSVMLLRETATTILTLDPTVRVVRGGRVTLARPAEGPTWPVVRVDLTIDGEHVMVFAPIHK